MPLLGFAVTGALVLAACGGGGSSEELSSDTATEASAATSAATSTTTSTTTEPVDVASAATESAPADSTITVAPVTDPPEADSAPSDAAGGGDCLVGDWVITQEEMNNYYGSITDAMSAPLTISVVGSAPISLNGDGTYRWAPDFTLIVEVAGVQGTGESSGEVTGNWVAVDGTVVTSSDVNALEVSITVGGGTIDGASMANGFLNMSPVNGVTYSCEGATPVLDFLTGDPDVTVPVELTPA